MTGLSQGLLVPKNAALLITLSHLILEAQKHLKSLLLVINQLLDLNWYQIRPNRLNNLICRKNQFCHFVLDLKTIKPEKY